MQQKDRQRFHKMISVISEIVRQELSKPAIDLYFDLLSDFEIEKIEDSAKRLLKDRTYSSFPKPAEFIKLMAPDMDAIAIEASRIAFNVLWTEGESHGFNKWSDPLIPVVISRLGGWISQAKEVERICLLKDSQIQESIWRKQFETIYKSEARKGGGLIIYGLVNL